MADVIRVVGLRQTYGDIHALDGLDLAVPEGTVTALLGPNADEGFAEVAGIVAARVPHCLRGSSGVGTLHVRRTVR